jgi:UDP-2,3-diacylglucosamine pyrophosphatase LpxH
MEKGAEVEVVLGDLHVGHPQSKWRQAVEWLATLDAQYRVFAFYFAGDTLELAYAHEFGEAASLQPEYDRFFQRLRDMGLAARCVFLLGNHDSSLEVLPSSHDFVVAQYAWLFCQTFHVLILHGHGVGYTRLASAYGRSAEALRQLRQRLATKPLASLPTLGKRDWLVTGHFDVPVRDLLGRVVGLGSWVGDLNRDDRGYYAILQPNTSDAPIVLKKYQAMQPLKVRHVFRVE